MLRADRSDIGTPRRNDQRSVRPRKQNGRRALPDLVHRLTGPRRVKAVRLSGPARSDGRTLQALYLGSGTNLGFLKRYFFLVARTETLDVGCPPARIRAAARALSRDVHLVLTEQPPLWHYLAPVDADVTVPAWVSQVLTLSPPAQQHRLLPPRLEKEIKRLRARHAYRLDVSTCPQTLRRFYREYYLPYVHARFDDAAVTIPEREFLRRARGQRLVRLHAGSRWVAGMLIRRRGTTLRLGWFGIAGDHAAPGASEVLDALCIRQEHERGVRRVVMGLSRPCLTDGVLRYKKKFGARVAGTRFPQAALGISVRRWSPGVRACFQEQPLITVRRGVPFIVSVAGTAEPTIGLRLLYPEAAGHGRHE